MHFCDAVAKGVTVLSMEWENGLLSYDVLILVCYMCRQYREDNDHLLELQITTSFVNVQCLMNKID